MANSKKISNFTQSTTFEQADLINVVRSSTNFGVPFSALATALGVTGTINVVGGTGVPVLEQPNGTVNNIRTIENGYGILASVSAQNGVSVKQDITVNATGAALIVNKNVQSPVYRSIVAGSGVAVAVSGETIVVSASAVGATNTVIINQESDFPAADAGVITLADNTNYIIAASVSTSSRFLLGSNNAITANNIFTPVLTYTGSGTMFTGVDKNITISAMSVDCPNGTVWGMTSPTTVGGNFLVMDNFIVISCATYGTVDNLRAVTITNSSALEADQGLTVSGSSNWSVFSISRFGLTSTSSSFIGIDFGSSVHQTLEIDNLINRAPAGAIGIKGALSSANLTSGNLATVTNSEFTGGITPISVITNEDIRWEFQRNTGIANTLSDALLGFNANTTETVIGTINTPVLVNATWVLEGSAKFTTTTAGRATYTAEQSINVPIDIAVGLIASGGGSNNVSVYLCLNGSVITNTGRTISISGSNPQSISIPWQLALSENDYIEVKVENNSGTTNIIVEHAILRIN